MKKFFTVIFAALFVSALFCGEVPAKDIKFVQITDVHYTVQNEYSGEALAGAIEEINKLENVAFVIFTGDNIGSPRKDNLVGFVRTANKLNVPYYLVIGNHDVYKTNGMSKVNYIDIVKDNNILYKPSKPNYVFKKNGFVFIVVDGAKEIIPGSIGYYRDSTLEWLDKQLKKYKKRPVIICQHYPLIEPKEHKSHRTYQPEKYFEVLNKNKNVIAIISGHYHVNGEKMQDGIYHISTPALINPPNYYKVIDIVTTPGFSPMIYTELKSADVK